MTNPKRPELSTYRYTFAAEKKNYPLTNIDSTGFDGFFATPTSPTLCFPVTEFDLSK
jgi:hypothetical protein